MHEQYEQRAFGGVVRWTALFCPTLSLIVRPAGWLDRVRYMVLSNRWANVSCFLVGRPFSWAGVFGPVHHLFAVLIYPLMDGEWWDFWSIAESPVQ